MTNSDKKERRLGMKPLLVEMGQTKEIVLRLARRVQFAITNIQSTRDIEVTLRTINKDTEMVKRKANNGAHVYSNKLPRSNIKPEFCPIRCYSNEITLVDYSYEAATSTMYFQLVLHGIELEPTKFKASYQYNLAITADAKKIASIDINTVTQFNTKPETETRAFEIHYTDTDSRPPAFQNMRLQTQSILLPEMDVIEEESETETETELPLNKVEYDSFATASYNPYEELLWPPATMYATDFFPTEETDLTCYNPYQIL